MKNNISNEEWVLAEKAAKEYEDSISMYFMENVAATGYVDVEVLIPLTENVNRIFNFQAPAEYLDADNTELKEYFNEHIHPIKEVPSSIPKSKYIVSHMVIPLAGEYYGNHGVVIGVNEPTGNMTERSYRINFEDLGKEAVITESLLTGDFIGFYEGTVKLPACEKDQEELQEQENLNNSVIDDVPLYEAKVVNNEKATETFKKLWEEISDYSFDEVQNI